MSTCCQQLISALQPYEAELERVVDFWLQRCVDREYGGYLTQIDRCGRVFGTDKNGWVQARQCWTFAALCNAWDNRSAWREAAQFGRDFIVQHMHLGGGRWRYLLTREGQSLDDALSLATDCNVMTALAEHAVMSGTREDEALIEMTFDQFERHLGPPAVNQWHHFSLDSDRLWLAPYMLVLGAVPSLRQVLDEKRVEPLATQALKTITQQFARADAEVVFEVLHLDGTPVDGPLGRRVNPGHAIEAAWFCAEEAMYRKDDHALARAADMCRWAFRLGHDPEHGGMLAFADRDGGRPLGPETMNAWGDRWDDKLWWVQSESLYGLALAASVTDDPALLDAFTAVHEFVQRYQIDHEYGEWYEVLHRYGEPRSPLKGSWIKCMFHVTRNLLKMVELRQKLMARTCSTD